MDKYTIIAVMGESASGKDSIVKRLLETTKNLNKKISTTTRPMRDYEKEGVDYFFNTEEEFAIKVCNYDMLEADNFNDWFYGTEIKSLRKDKVNIGVFTPNGVRALLEDERIERVIPVYVICDYKTRLIRSLNREKNPNIDEIYRRYKADVEDFYDIDFEYLEVQNDKSLDEVAEKLKRDICVILGQKL